MKNSMNQVMRFLLVAFVLSAGPVVLVAQSEIKSSSHVHKAGELGVLKSELKYEAKVGFQKITFEEIGAFPIKVEWVMNLTNSAADSLKRDGEIPARVKALDGKRVSIAGFMKPIKQEEGGAAGFLLVKDYSTCCEGTLPKINEMIHVQMASNSIPQAGEQIFAVRGVFQVGEKLGAGNTVSIYRLEGAELEVVDSRRGGR
jgi:hypothetical protein